MLLKQVDPPKVPFAGHPRNVFNQTVQPTGAREAAAARVTPRRPPAAQGFTSLTSGQLHVLLRSGGGSESEGGWGGRVRWMLSASLRDCGVL